MPYMNSELARLHIARVFSDQGRKAVRVLAEKTGIPYGSLRNAVGGIDEINLGRIIQIEEALGLEPPGCLVATDPQPQPEGTPKPGKSPQPERNSGPGRDSDERQGSRRDGAKKGPRRPASRDAA